MYFHSLVKQLSIEYTCPKLSPIKPWMCQRELQQYEEPPWGCCCSHGGLSRTWCAFFSSRHCHPSAPQSHTHKTICCTHSGTDFMTCYIEDRSWAKMATVNQTNISSIRRTAGRPPWWPTSPYKPLRKTNENNIGLHIMHFTIQKHKVSPHDMTFHTEFHRPLPTRKGGVAFGNAP